jgi:hypothetical protein
VIDLHFGFIDQDPRRQENRPLLGTRPRFGTRSLIVSRRRRSAARAHDSASMERITMNGNRYYGIRVEGAKYGVGFGSALAIAISYTNNHSILWAIIHGILGWLYVIYVALFG